MIQFMLWCINAEKLLYDWISIPTLFHARAIIAPSRSDSIDLPVRVRSYVNAANNAAEPVNCPSSVDRDSDENLCLPVAYLLVNVKIYIVSEFIAQNNPPGEIHNANTLMSKHTNPSLAN
jgi:hypothetical protein